MYSLEYQNGCHPSVGQRPTSGGIKSLGWKIFTILAILFSILGLSLFYGTFRLSFEHFLVARYLEIRKTSIHIFLLVKKKLPPEF